MKVKDLKQEDIKIGLRIKSLISDMCGTIVKINSKDDDYAEIQWDGESIPTTGFYGNDCDCEVVLRET